MITEQNALFAPAHADRGYVMEKGPIRYASGTEALRGATRFGPISAWRQPAEPEAG